MKLHTDKFIMRDNIYKKIEVTKESTFSAAIRIKKKHKKICALNFSSSTKNAQEESLSRKSTLYFTLVEQKSFYDHNKQHYNSFGTDYMIYSPKVIILRDDNDILINPVKVSIISAVDINYSELMQIYYHGEQNKKVYDVMKKRCRRIIKLCLNKGNDVMILGAFDCGVFKNLPHKISQIFKEILIDEYYGFEFSKIESQLRQHQTNLMIYIKCLIRLYLKIRTY